MNYIKQLNEFYSTLDYNPLSANAIAIYMILLHIANKTGWVNEFRVANPVLMSKCNLDKQTVERARNELLSKGYINYQKGKNQNSAPVYHINILYRMDIIDNMANDMPDNVAEDTVTNTTDNTADDTADNTAGNTINKQNKTKQNNKLNEFNLYSNFEKNLKCDCISQTTGEKCQRRSSYHINGKNYCNQHGKSILSKFFRENHQDDKKKYGEFENVLLNDEQYKKLVDDFPNDYEDRIQRLDDYIQSKGKRYKDHLATIRNWARKEGYKKPRKVENEYKAICTDGLTQTEYKKIMRGEKDV